MKIAYVKHKDIDKAKWDACITQSVNGIVYAYSWYLDIMADRWDALIGDDYKAVFPLTFKTKFCISYLYQPYFTQQLGLFSSGPVGGGVVERFLDAIPSKFRFISINLNTFLKFQYPKAQVTPLVTHHLDLIEPYITISSRYTTNTKRSVSKAVAYDVTVKKGIRAQDLIALKKENLIVPLNQKHFDSLLQLIMRSVSLGIGEVYGAYDSSGVLCAGALFIKSNGKVIFLLASSTTKGRENRAMFALVDRFIDQNAETQLVLDFEGSNVESVARFYKGFGATPIMYNHLEINRLPWFLRFLKR